MAGGWDDNFNRYTRLLTLFDKYRGIIYVKLFRNIFPVSNDCFNTDEQFIGQLCIGQPIPNQIQ
jgi:hypothetical protein